MKVSLKIQDNHHQQQPALPPQPPNQKNQNQPLLFRAKIPITIFNLPFLSAFSTTTHQPSDLSLSLSTNFPSGPTLKLSYSTTTTTTTATTSSPPPPPFTLTLKSGIGLYGSTKDSPLIISANFAFSPNNLNSSPTFSLLFKPQLGSFSLRKSTFSNTPGSPRSGTINGEGSESSFDFVPLERPVSLKDFSVENNGKDSIFKGISMMARTEMPFGERVLMNLRWGVNFPGELSQKMPYLVVNKIGIQRVDQVKERKEEGKEEKKKNDLELLRGMCVWMKRELDMLQRENREMKCKLEEMKLGQMGRNGVGGSSTGGGMSSEVTRKKMMPVVEDLSGFEQWRSKKNGGEEKLKKEVKKNGSDGVGMSDFESELQKAIKAASSS